MIIHPDEFSAENPLENTSAVFLFNLVGLVVLVVGVVKSAACFGRNDDDDETGSTVESFTISPWNCFCNWFKSTEKIGWTQDDARFTTYSVKSMNITTPDEKKTPGKTYLPNGVDGVGTSTRKYLEAHGSDQQLPQSDRRKLEDNRVIMKAYLISRLVAARYSFEEGTMEFEESAEDRNIEIDDYKKRTQAMYDLLYSGQIMVDTRATRRQQRVALKRLRKSNLNLRPSKIRELARQMKEEAEKDQEETGSSGIGSTCDISKAETTTVADSNPSRASGESRFSRFLQRMGLRSSRDSAVGSSLGSVDRLGGVAVIDVQETNNWSKPRNQPLHTYGGAQF